ncbi:unnamed protein product [Moneuplotes crassus]|uniref:Uncharacterized protein n=1 Tax=Euplotes crassus TaxID=5936 RepID=A0AAD1XMN8_EUPCR|nr:unnamed protein product [Moneuplotes crassus]
MESMNKDDAHSSGKVLARARRLIIPTCHNPSCACFVMDRINGISLNLCAIEKILNPNIDGTKGGKDDKQKNLEQDFKHAASQGHLESDKDDLQIQTDFSEKLEEDLEEEKKLLSSQSDPPQVPSYQQIEQLTDKDLKDRYETLRNKIKSSKEQSTLLADQVNKTLCTKISAEAEMKIISRRIPNDQEEVERANKEQQKANQKLTKATQHYNLAELRKKISILTERRV